MDLNAIKSKLANLQSKNTGSSRKDFKDIYWRPEVGKQTIRIVPSKFDKKNPFKELFIHYGIDKPVMISPTNFGEKDPIVEFANQLRKTSDKENWSLAGKLNPKMRVFVPVVVRGEEEKGVRLWQFGKEIYMELLSMAEDDDIGDYTDIAAGRDITVETTKGNPYNKTTVRVKTKQTPLAEDAETVKAWIDDQPNPTEGFKRYTFDEMKEALQNWLSPEAKEGEIVDDEKTVETEETEEGGDLPWEKEQKPAKPYTLDTKPKVSKAAKFDELFSEDED
jgi:hypothetical protein